MILEGADVAWSTRELAELAGVAYEQFLPEANLIMGGVAKLVPLTERVPSSQLRQ